MIDKLLALYVLLTLIQTLWMFYRDCEFMSYRGGELKHQYDKEVLQTNYMNMKQAYLDVISELAKAQNEIIKLKKGLE